MTSAALHLVAPTQTERRLLRLADWLTASVEHRIAHRADKRAHELEMLRVQQAPSQDPRELTRALAQLDIPRF